MNLNLDLVTARVTVFVSQLSPYKPLILNRNDTVTVGDS